MLNGKAGAFEDFITGLWYYVSPQGTLDNRQYIYFDPANRELIFYMDETQQVFHWQNSSVTRYGLYISSRNISVTTLRRFLDLELESLDSIRAKVFEDVRLKIGVNAPWDGSYRRAVPPANSGRANSPASFYINAVYDGSLGKIRFAKDGSYEHNLGNNQRKGKYAFFFLGGKELLEFRSGGGNNPVREIYLVESGENPAESGENGEEGRPRENMILRRARLGARGIQELREGAIFLSLSGD